MLKWCSLEKLASDEGIEEGKDNEEEEEKEKGDQ